MAVAVIAVILVADVRGAIGFSSFAALLATGAAVWLTRERRTPPATAAEARTQR